MKSLRFFCVFVSLAAISLDGVPVFSMNFTSRYNKAELKKPNAVEEQELNVATEQSKLMAMSKEDLCQYLKDNGYNLVYDRAYLPNSDFEAKDIYDLLEHGKLFKGDYNPGEATLVARNLLQNLKNNRLQESETIAQFKKIANLMDKYNKGQEQLLAPYQCQYLVPERTSKEDVSSYEIGNFSENPLLLGLVVKYDAQVALMRGDRTKHLELSKKIYDIWVAGQYGLKSVSLGSETAQYLKKTDYESACVMNFAFRYTNANKPTVFNFAQEPEAFSLLTGGGLRDYQSRLAQHLSLKGVQNYWSKLSQSAFYVNSLCFQEKEYNFYLDPAKSGVATLEKTIKDWVNDFSQSKTAVAHFDLDMVMSMHKSFQEYLKELKDIMQLDKNYTIYDFGASSGDSREGGNLSKNTCGFNSLFFEDAVAGNAKHKNIIEEEPRKKVEAGENLREVGCALFHHLYACGDLAKKKPASVSEPAYDPSSNQMLAHAQPHKEFLVIEGACIQDAPDELEFFAYAGNSNCIVLQERESLKKTLKSVNVFSPLLPIKFIHYDGSGHFRRAIFGEYPASDFQKDRNPASRDILDIIVRYVDPKEGGESSWHKTVLSKLLNATLAPKS